MGLDLTLITGVEHIFDYAFSNKLCGAEAVQMEGPRSLISYENHMRKVEKNTRLAVLGSVVTAKVICDSWYEDGSSTPAIWNTMRTDFLDNEELAKRGRRLGLDKCIAMAPSTAVASDKMVATTFLAVLGAIYKDGGNKALERVLGNLGVEIWSGPSSDGSSDSFERV